jgi:hypothetical protein
MMKSIRKLSLLGVLVLTGLLIGCASTTTGVVPMGRDTYMIAKEQGSGFPGLGTMKGEIITEAVQFCAKQGKEFQIISTKETQPPYILGNYPRSEIEFMCLNAGDKELQRPKLQPVPNTVIQVK